MHVCGCHALCGAMWSQEWVHEWVCITVAKYFDRLVCSWGLLYFVTHHHLPHHYLSVCLFIGGLSHGCGWGSPTPMHRIGSNSMHFVGHFFNWPVCGATIGNIVIDAPPFNSPRARWWHRAVAKHGPKGFPINTTRSIEQKDSYSSASPSSIIAGCSNNITLVYRNKTVS